MNRVGRKQAPVLVSILLLTSVLAAARDAKTPTPSDSMTVEQARRAVAAGILDGTAADPGSFRFTRNSVEFQHKMGGRLKIDLKTLEPVVITRKKNGRFWWWRLTDAAGREIPPLDTFWYLGKEEAAARSLAAALNRLRELRAFIPNTETLRTFTQQAADWRALPTKPPLPEEVRQRRLLGENAVKEKNPEEALEHYENGLAVYPTWPQGWFNAALISAELQCYADAIQYMQAYLELVPEAPDAQSARDQIAIWQYKARGTR